MLDGSVMISDSGVTTTSDASSEGSDASSVDAGVADASCACTGGCCMEGSCLPGDASSACGLNGQTCVNCAIPPSSGLACLQGRCGCASAADCPAGRACDLGVAICSPSCGGDAGLYSNCSSGCCDVGQCQTDCSQSSNGSVCVGGSCGCNVVSDCPIGKACNTSTRLCTSSCGGASFSVCNQGCCDGNVCASACSGSANGYVCLNGSCGCMQATDCNSVLACDTKTNLCTSFCGGPNQTPCNHGCCDISTGCQLGTSSTDCGPAGSFCSTCPASEPNCVGGSCVGNDGGACFATGSPCTGCTLCFLCDGGTPCSRCCSGLCGGPETVCCAGPGSTCAHNAQCCSGSCSVQLGCH
jgi:hypothetical protein